MLHTIGKSPQGEGLVELLLGCHGRIRSFTSLAIALGEGIDTPTNDVVDGCTRVRRYFSAALPLHVEDEEEGLFPRMYGRSPEIDAALDRMCSEHSAHAEPLRRMIALTTSLAGDPGDTTARAVLARVATELQQLFTPHLEAEERLIFPAIATLVPEDEQRAIVRELRARRRPP
ncbi:MAG: hemerythrin domain-containing protein [Polyangiaceae bacterium]